MTEFFNILKRLWKAYGLIILLGGALLLVGLGLLGWGGLNYSGSRVSMFDISSSNSDHMRRILSRFPAGSMVEVHYDPSDPGEALLEPGFRGGMIFPFAIGAVLCLFGWLISRWIIGDLLAGGLFSAPG